MEYRQNSKRENSAKIRLESAKGVWDLMLAAPGIYHGKGIYEVSEDTLQILDQKGIAYKRIQQTSVV